MENESQNTAATMISIDKKLLQEVRVLSKQMRKLTSFRMTFLRGIVAGVGTFLGATIVAGLLLASLSQVIDTTKQVEFINNIFDQFGIERVVDDAGHN